MVLLAAFGVMSMLNSALIATLAMFLTGCISLEDGFRSIEWDTIVVLGAAVGLEAAVTGSGLSAEIAELLGRIGGGSSIVALTAVFVGAVLMTNVITNAAAAAFMFPIAVSLSDQMGLSVEPFVVVLMLGCSYAFVNPAGYQTNLMVQKPGQYSFADFVKVGLPLTLIVGAVALVLSFLLYL
jgi:di/tricarboxylate transporter